MAKTRAKSAAKVQRPPATRRRTRKAATPPTVRVRMSGGGETVVLLAKPESRLTGRYLMKELFD